MAGHDASPASSSTPRAPDTTPDLSGKVCLVAGATRGTGRGIACALGEAGAVVYCTGRTTRQHRSEMDRDETIEQTAELVDSLGGVGVAVQVDHQDPDAVAALVERIRSERGRLDLVVNDIWGGDAKVPWGKRYWEAEAVEGWEVLQNALRTHWLTAAATGPLLVESGGLLVEVTDGDTMQFRGNVLYDLIKTSVIRAAFGFDQDLKSTDGGARAVCVTPGFLRSEAMLDHFGVSESNWRDGAAKDPHFAFSETPRFVGRGIAHLVAEQDRGAVAGRVWASWTLSRRYGFVDVDGSRPDWGAHYVDAFGEDAYRPVSDAMLDDWAAQPFGEPDA